MFKPPKPKLVPPKVIAPKPPKQPKPPREDKGVSGWKGAIDASKKKRTRSKKIDFNAVPPDLREFYVAFLRIGFAIDQVRILKDCFAECKLLNPGEIKEALDLLIQNQNYLWEHLMGGGGDAIERTLTYGQAYPEKREPDPSDSMRHDLYDDDEVDWVDLEEAADEDRIEVHVAEEGVIPVYRCKICHALCELTPSGFVCDNGHGGQEYEAMQ